MTKVVGRLAAAMIVVGVIGFAALLPFGAASVLQMAAQCPDGADCPDARTVTVIVAVGALACSAVVCTGVAMRNRLQTRVPNRAGAKTGGD